jgi:predicted acylesterase/phospholipase RssA
MKARIGIAMGRYWGGIAYAFDVMAAISALGAIGALPALLNALVRFTRLKFPIAITLTAFLFALPGCARTPIRGSASAEGDAPNAIRTLGSDLRFSTLSSQSVARRVRAEHPGQPVNILALSGGGADGAFGAGALVGLTRSTRRPEFSVVTGVSTGALIAPYAFLGPDWDDELVEVYTSGRAEHLLKSRGLGAFFGSSIYSGTPLKELVDRYATDALIQAVAREASTGRLLLVATTDVSTGEPVIWDLGSIAMNGGAGARALFRDVLVASASVPGLFPPVVIHVQDQQALYEEVHVDGTVALPFFVPLGFLESGTAVYVIVDGRLSQQPASMRTTLELTASDAQLEGAQFQFAAIPVAYPQLHSFDFSTSTMRSLFQFGYQCAESGRLWTASRSAGRDDASRASSGAGQPAQCPADDEFIGRLAVR